MDTRRARQVKQKLQALISALGSGLLFAAGLAQAQTSATDASSTEGGECSLGRVESLQRPGKLIAPDSFSCRITFAAHPGAKIHPFRLVGKEASGSVIDCAGQMIDSVAFGLHPSVPNVTVASLQGADQSWSAPRNIEIRNCRFLGQFVATGMGLGAADPVARDSSLREGHTARAQAAAPQSIRIVKSEFNTTGRTPIYIGPGVTTFALEESKILGRADGAVIYLDAESKGAVIRNNDFLVSSNTREIVAIDGSAENVVTNNVFHDASKGGVYLYRNCGEGGAIRHQTPSRNQILSNKFLFRGSPTGKAVWVNSRMGKSRFCKIDSSHPFGSSLDPLDGGEGNLVRGNISEGGGAACIRSSGDKNEVKENACR